MKAHGKKRAAARRRQMIASGTMTKRDMEAQWEREEAPVIKVQEDPRIVVLSARCRHMNKPDTKETRLALSWQMMGDPAGRAIRIEARDDADKLWDMFCRLDARHDAYRRRNIGRPRFAKVTKMEYLPETFETREDDSNDHRTPEEKDRDATNGWQRWLGFMRRMTVHERMAIYDGLWRRCDLTKGGISTTAGVQFVMALRVLRDIEQNG